MTTITRIYKAEHEVALIADITFNDGDELRGVPLPVTHDAGEATLAEWVAQAKLRGVEFADGTLINGLMPVIGEEDDYHA